MNERMMEFQNKVITVKKSKTQCWLISPYTSIKPRRGFWFE